MAHYDGELPRRLHHLPELRPSEIDKPGCYLVTGTGRLLRITEETLPWHALNPLPSSAWVARLSENPTETITRLRQVADANGYFVNF
jgi:hypothetical protein